MSDRHRKLIYRYENYGYELYEETHATDFEAVSISGDNEDIVNAINDSQPAIVKVRAAYTLNGDYIGDEETARRLCNIKHIKPELVKPNNKVCSIGFSGSRQKWYGWSHRAIYGFSVGDIVKEGDCCASSGYTDEYLKEHPEEDYRLPVGFKAHTLQQAKTMAIAFADSVS